MKLTTIIAAALPLLAAAVPRSIFDGGHQSDGEFSGTHPQHGDYAAPPGVGDQDIHQPPTEMSHSHNNGGSDMMGGDAHQADDGDRREQLEQRDLEARVDSGSIDHYIEECTAPTNNPSEKLCVRNLVIPKGKINGGCVERMQKGAFLGTMHLLESNVMCKYYQQSGCKGRMSGPYSNIQCDYTYTSAYYGQILTNPQSVFCEIISFDESRRPVEPPFPDPMPPIGMAYDCKISTSNVEVVNFLLPKDDR